MKNSRNQENNQSKAPAINNNRPRPENKDDLDSRKNLEQNDEQTTHHTKATHEGDHAKTEHNNKRGTRKSEE